MYEDFKERLDYMLSSESKKDLRVDRNLTMFVYVLSDDHTRQNSSRAKQLQNELSNRMPNHGTASQVEKTSDHLLAEVNNFVLQNETFPNFGPSQNNSVKGLFEPPKNYPWSSSFNKTPFKTLF